MHHLTSWEAYTGSVAEWLGGLLEAEDIKPDDIVWRGEDGSYAVGSDWPTDKDFDTEMVDDGNVAEWLDAAFA